MIRSFLHKGLKELFVSGSSAKVGADLHKRCLRRLDVLNLASDLSDLDMSGYRFHLLGGKPQRYSLWVNAAWRITFEWVDGDAWRVDLEQYH